MNGVGWETGVMEVSQDVSFGASRVTQNEKEKKKVFWDVWEHIVIVIIEIG